MATKARKSRLDLSLVERGLVPSRTKAQALIMARRVKVAGEHVTKPGTMIREESTIEIDQPEHPWVSRGGVKLAGALDHFGIDPAGLVVADIGASTGGFTHVMLGRGAARVYAIDVGYGQLDQSLREDERVVVIERFNARYLTRDDLPELVSVISIDVSFISLALILPAAVSILDPDGVVIALIKPQFEVGRENVGKGGIVRDEKARLATVDKVTRAALELGLVRRGLIESPIRGAEGNVEYLVYLHRRPPEVCDSPV